MKIQLPKTEEELEAFFELLKLFELNKRRHVRPFGTGSENIPQDYHEQKYQKAKEEYFKMIDIIL